MTIQETYNRIEHLKAGSYSKSDIKIYEEFLIILKNLKNRDFLKEETEALEAKLSSLNLESNSQNSKKHYKKALDEFKSFLNKTFSLVTKNYYTNLYLSLGAGLGVISGIIIGERFEKSLGIALGIGVGMLIGLPRQI
ncbi:MAG: hypothetical protein KUG68_07405 [Flavobacteriaceae bacterium]|nr:hypothetical protein [Flavobacteriaceae bacterium]